MGKWEMVRLGDVFLSIKNGANIKQGDEEGSGYPITRIETISYGRINRKKMGYAGIMDVAPYSDYILESGDILMSHINSAKHLGKTALYEVKNNEAIIHGMNLLRLRPNQEIINCKYAKHFFDTYSFKKQIPNITKNSVNQSSFTVKALANLIIPLPPLAVQQQIVDVLDRASSLIEKRKAQIEKLDLLVKSQFVEMFGDPATNPKNWGMGTIRDLVIDVKYGTSKPAEQDGKYVYLRMNNITYEGHLDLTDLKYINVDEKDFEKYAVRKGDILFNRTNSRELVGKTAVFKEDTPMVIAGYIIRVRTNDKANYEYISAYLNSQFGKRLLYGMCKAIVGQANINAQELQDIAIMVPPRSLQDEFAAFIQKVCNTKKLAERALSQYEILYKSLIQKCFLGDIE